MYLIIKRLVKLFCKIIRRSFGTEATADFSNAFFVIYFNDKFYFLFSDDDGNVDNNNSNDNDFDDNFDSW